MMRRTLATVFLALTLAGAGLTYAMHQETARPTPATATSDHGLLGAAERAAGDVADATQEACRSLLESAGLDPHDCELQGDGGHAGDASDVCEEPDPMLERDMRTTGLLPPGDPEDDYALFVDQAALGTTLEVAVYANGDVATKALQAFHVIVHAPGCAYPAAVGEPYGYASVARFVPEEPGVYTVQVLPVEGSPEDPNVADVLAPRTGRCHPSCAEPLNDAMGYELRNE